MEAFIYFTVRLIVAIYILYKVWVWLFGGAAEKHIWDKIPVRNPKKKPEPKPHPTANPIVGSTRSVILEDPGRGTPPIPDSMDLEPTGYIGSEDSISADDVESDYNTPEVLSDEELYDEPDANGYDPELSGGGVTFEQIGEAINALTETGAVDEAAKSRARNTLIELQDTDILDMITREVCDESTLEQFMNDSDMSGKVEKPDDIRLKDFDMTKYV